MANFSKRFSLATGWLICGLGALFYCYEYLLRIEPNVMAPELMRAFSLHAEQFGFLISLYYLAYTPMQILVGTITDLYGARRILTAALTACVMGSFIFSTTNSAYIAAIGRFLIGFGSAFAFVGVLKLASVWLPNKHFAFATGIATSLGMIGALMGEIELTKLVTNIGYKHALIYSTVIGIILLPLIWLVVRDHPPNDASTPLLNQHKYREIFIGLKRIIKNLQIWIVGFIGCILYLSLSVFAELWGNLFLRQAYGFSNKQASHLISLIFLGWLIGAPAIGWLSDRLKNRRLFLLIGLFLTAMISLLILFSPYHSYSALRVFLFLFGICSSTEVLAFAVAREISPYHLAGSAVAFINMLVMLGGLIFQPIVGWLLDFNWTGAYINQVRVYSLYDFQISLIFIPTLCLIAGITGIWLKDSYYQGEQQTLWQMKNN